MKNIWVGFLFAGTLLLLSSCAPAIAGKKSILRATGSYGSIAFSFDCNPANGGYLDLNKNVFFQCDSIDQNKIATLSVLILKSENGKTTDLKFGLALHSSINGATINLGLNTGFSGGLSSWALLDKAGYSGDFSATWGGGTTVIGQISLTTD